MTYLQNDKIIIKYKRELKMEKKGKEKMKNKYEMMSIKRSIYCTAVY